jgi:hypothetical protein
MASNKKPTGIVRSSQQPPVVTDTGYQWEMIYKQKYRIHGPEAAVTFDNLIHIKLVLKVKKFFTTI